MAQKSKVDIVSSITTFHFVGLRDWIVHLAIWPLLAGTFTHLLLHIRKLLGQTDHCYHFSFITSFLLPTCYVLACFHPSLDSFVGSKLLFPIAFSIVLGKLSLTPRIGCKWILGAFCILISRGAHSKEQSVGEKFGLSYERAGTCI